MQLINMSVVTGATPMYSLQISIVIPCYNAEKTLTRTLESVLHQNYRKIEIIIVDDGSTDSTAEIINNYQKKYSFIKGFKQKNKGVSAARNYGITLAVNNWIALLDSDDIFYKNSLTERINTICEDTNPNMLGVFCPAEMIFENGKKMGFGRLFGSINPDGKVFFPHTSECIFAPSCVILNKKHFIKTGGFDETISPAEDYDLWQRMLRSGGYFQFVKTCTIGYTQHPDSAVRTRVMTHYSQCKKVIKRIASKANFGIRECKDGYGESLYYVSLTQRALSTAFMAIATQQFQIVAAVIPDINLYAIETFDVTKIEALLKFSAVRALCRHESEWHYQIRPYIRNDVINFFENLNKKFNGESQNIKKLLKIFQETPVPPPVSIAQKSDDTTTKPSKVTYIISKIKVYVYIKMKNYIKETIKWLKWHKKEAFLLYCFMFFLYGCNYAFYSNGLLIFM